MQSCFITACYNLSRCVKNKLFARGYTMKSVICKKTTMYLQQNSKSSPVYK